MFGEMKMNLRFVSNTESDMWIPTTSADGEFFTIADDMLTNTAEAVLSDIGAEIEMDGPTHITDELPHKRPYDFYQADYCLVVFPHLTTYNCSKFKPRTIFIPYVVKKSTLDLVEMVNNKTDFFKIRPYYSKDNTVTTFDNKQHVEFVTSPRGVILKNVLLDCTNVNIMYYAQQVITPTQTLKA